MGAREPQQATKGDGRRSSGATRACLISSAQYSRALYSRARGAAIAGFVGHDASSDPDGPSVSAGGALLGRPGELALEEVLQLLLL